MENASDAIIMAGAMLIFVIALSVAMTAFSQARATIDMVVYASDKTNYYDYLETTGSNNVKNRIVGLETIIPTLYKYYKENYTVVFLDKGEPVKGLTLYKTQTNSNLWSGNTNGDNSTIPPIVNKYPGVTDNKTICSFDMDEEISRNEPWTGSTIDYKKNLDAFLKGGTFNYPSGALDEDGKPMQYNYKKYFSKGSFIAQYADKQFIETIGEYSTSTNDSTSISSLLDQGIRNQKNKRVIIYQLIN